MEANSAVSRADGIGEKDLAALRAYANHPSFTECEQAALAYADSMTGGHTVPDGIFARVRRCFNEDEIVELTAVIAWEICAAKFNRALEIEGQGICELPGAGTP